MVYLLAMIISTSGGQPLSVSLRVHQTEAECRTEMQLLEQKEEQKSQGRRVVRNVDFVCQEKVR